MADGGFGNRRRLQGGKQEAKTAAATANEVEQVSAPWRRVGGIEVVREPDGGSLAQLRGRSAKGANRLDRHDRCKGCGCGAGEER